MNINKTKIVLGVFIALLGGIIMVTNMVFAIISTSGKLYEDAYIFDVNFQEFLKTPQLTINKNQKLSIWLKVPNRQIENKDIEFTASLVGRDDNVNAKFNENFRLGYLRNSSGTGQYYRLGEHHFDDNFNGYFRCETKGKWIPPYKGHLVLREGKGISVPVKNIGLFIIGIFILMVGIGTIIKNSKQINR